MNDLAEKALQGLDAARRGIAARPVPWLAVGGFFAAAVVVVTGARIGAAPAAVPVGRWLGLLPAAGYRITGAAMGVAMLGAIGALIGLWLLTLHVVRVHVLRDRDLWTIAAAWSVPLLVGPPVLSTDIFGYVARGLLARHGLSPYHHAPTALGDQRIVDAIDPTWRGVRSTDGPLTSLGEHLVVAVTSGRVIASVLVIRAVAVLSVILIGRLAADLAGPRRATALALTILNPAVLIYLVSAGQVAGPLAAVLLATLLAASQRRWALAVVLVCVAGGIEPVALLAVPAVIAAHVLGNGVERGRRVWLRDAAVAGGTLVVVGVAVPFGLGWLRNLTSAAHEHVPFAPCNLIADVIGFVVPSASFDDLIAGGRIATGAAGVTVIGYLLVTVGARPLERTVGFTLLTAAILAPVVYPQFLLWGVLCLAPAAVRGRRDWVVALSCVACVLTPAGLGQRGGDYATIVALTTVAVVLAPRLITRYRNDLAAARRASAGG